MAYSLSVCVFSFIALTYAVQESAGVNCEVGDDTFRFPCTGDFCVAERILSQTDRPVTTYLCLDKNRNPHWRDVCNGLTATDTNVPQCCIEDGCHLRLTPRLPSEPPVTTSYLPYMPGPLATTLPTTQVIELNQTSSSSTAEPTPTTKNNSTVIPTQSTTTDVTDTDVPTTDDSSNCVIPIEPTKGTITAFYTNGGVLSHEQLNETAEEFTVLNYQCDSGLYLSGPNNITCTDGGQWSFDPGNITCLNSCPVPASELDNGRITAFFTDGTVLDYEQLNETVLEETELMYRCDSGYTFNIITCSSTGVWSFSPERFFCYNYVYSTRATVSTSLVVGGVVSGWLLIMGLFLLCCAPACWYKRRQRKKMFHLSLHA